MSCEMFSVASVASMVMSGLMVHLFTKGCNIKDAMLVILCGVAVFGPTILFSVGAGLGIVAAIKVYNFFKLFFVFDEN